jgi:hypothetical protein
MGRGSQLNHESGGEGRTFTKQELLEVSGLSAKTFDVIRKAARVRGPSHGGLNWKFSESDVVALIQRAGSGSFSERGGPAVIAWQAMLDG